MDFKSEYLKYKKLYLDLKKRSQSGGYIGLVDFIHNLYDVFIPTTIPNNGKPHDGEVMTNQCMFISISDYLKLRKIKIDGEEPTVARIRAVAGLDHSTNNPEFDDKDVKFQGAIRTLAQKLDLQFAIYNIDSTTGGIDPTLVSKHKDGKFYLHPIQLYTKDDIDNQSEIIDVGKTIHILYTPGHFSLITRIRHTNIHNLDKNSGNNIYSVFV